MMILSFIIPAYQSAYTLKRCLDGITSQKGLTSSAYEIIVILCRANQKELNIIQEYQIFKEIKVLHTKKKTDPYPGT